MMGTHSRRDFLALTGAVLAGAATAFGQAPPAGRKLYAYVGSYTSGRFGEGGGGGLTGFTVDMAKGALTQIYKSPAEFDSLNGGGMCISPDARFLYCLHEGATTLAPPAPGAAAGGRQAGPGGAGGGRGGLGPNGSGGSVLAFAINRMDGSLTYLNSVPSMGFAPVFAVVDRTGTRVIVANHGAIQQAVQIERRNGVPVIVNPTDDGTVAMFPVKADGSLEPASDVSVYDRKPLDQPGPGAAAHGMAFDSTGRWLIVSEVGLDALYVYPFDASSRTFGARKKFPTPPGRAPRHVSFHPTQPYFYITNERMNLTSAFRFDSRTGEVTALNTQPSIPETFTARSSQADVRVRPDGKFVYVNNRGHDSLAAYSINEATGNITLVEVAPGLGGTREFDFDPSGNFLFAANNSTSQVVTFASDRATGKLTPTGATAQVNRPAVIKFVML